MITLIPKNAGFCKKKTYSSVCQGIFIDCDFIKFNHIKKMKENLIIVQVSNDIFSHMADDLKYNGYTTFRGSCSYEVPDEEDFIVIYSGFNNGNLFPLFIAKVNRVFLKNESEYICSLFLVSKVVRIDKEFVENKFKYSPSCKTNMTELITPPLTIKIWETIQHAPLLAFWN